MTVDYTALDRIQEKIENNWYQTNSAPAFVDLMRQALFAGRDESLGNRRKLSQWALLPGLCCQAAGGDPQWAESFAAAWLLFYLAAHVMDSVEDQDIPDPWWADLGPGAAINVATGLFFSASKLLNHLYLHEATRPAAAEVVDAFHDGFLAMCGGQHSDLLLPEPALDQYWEIAAAKSGAFFAMACESGARFATQDPIHLNGYRRFGHHLGALIQVLDDLEEFQAAENQGIPFNPEGVGRSLPVVYARSVFPPAQLEKLNTLLKNSGENIAATRQALEMVESSGAALYIAAALEGQRTQALEALEQVQPLSPAKEALESFVKGLGSAN